MAWLHVHFHSETLRMPVAMEVLLPQHVSGGVRAAKHPGPYQALYLLHGMSDDHTAWMRRTSIERYTEGKPIAVVMPAGQLSWYTDMAYGRPYFRFITEELPAFCERMYPVSSSREDRFIAGLSMGGYGAMKAALHAPERYAAAASFSGAMDALGAWDRLGPRLAGDIFGAKERIAGGEHDLFASAAKLAASDRPRSRLYMWCGTEDFLYEENVRFQRHAKSLNLPLEYEEGPGGHSWAHWDRCIERTIPWLLNGRSAEGGN